MKVGKLEVTQVTHKSLGRIVEVSGPLEVSNYFDDNAENIVVRLTYDTVKKLAAELQAILEAEDAKTKDTYCGAV